MVKQTALSQTNLSKTTTVTKKSNNKFNSINFIKCAKNQALSQTFNTAHLHTIQSAAKTSITSKKTSTNAPSSSHFSINNATTPTHTNIQNTSNTQSTQTTPTTNISRNFTNVQNNTPATQTTRNSTTTSNSTDNLDVISSKSWLIWAIASMFYMYEMILRVFPSVITNDLMSTYMIDSTMLGLIVSCYYYAYTLLQIPCGLLLDKLGPKSLLSASALLCAIGAYFFVHTTSVYIAQLSRFLIGAGSACAFISCLQIASALFPSQYFPLLAGITNMMGTLGATFGSTPIAVATNTLGWKVTSDCLSVLGVILAVCIWFLFPKKLKQVGIEENKEHLLKSLKKIIKNNQIILAGLIAGFMYLPISAFSELWAVPFFAIKHNIDTESASLASAILFIGVAIGSVVTAVIADKIKSYIKTIKFSIICTTFLFLALIYLSNSTRMSFLIVFLIGLSTGAEVLGFTCAKIYSDKETEASSLAFANAIIMFIGCIFQSLLGYLLDFFWTGKMSASNLKIYDLVCYNKAILTLPICLVVAYGLCFFVRKKVE